MIIIKSLPRKTASFSQLIHYINKGRAAGDEYCFRHNVYSNKPHTIVREYLENSNFLKRRKNGNVLYHEIFSIKYQSGYTKEDLRKILLEAVEQYVKARAGNCLTYAVVHEQHNQIHMHLMISANEIGGSRPYYFSKAEFNKIVELTREYAYNKYPKLEREEKTPKKARARTKTVDNEVHFKKRTGRKSDRELMKERLQAIFAKSQTSHRFISSLQAEKIQVYQRGKTFGFLDEATGKKYRLKTLELEREFEELNKRFMKGENEKAQADNKRSLKPEQAKTHSPKADNGKKADKSGLEYIRDKVRAILLKSKSYNEFIKSLEDENIQIYRIGDTFGFIDKMTNYKYRLKTLGLEAEFTAFVQGANKKKTFGEKIKNFSKRFLHEIINDTEHLVTGQKPEMENEIWTQDSAGQRSKDTHQKDHIKTGLDKAKVEAREKFKKQMKETRTASKNQKTEDLEKRKK